MKKFFTRKPVFFTAVCFLFLDQASKWIVVEWFQAHPYPTSIIVIPGFFSIHYVTNSGSVWGFFQNATQVLGYLGIAAVIVLCIWYLKIQSASELECLAYGCLLGGILGNTLDRFRIHSVIDFLDFYYKNYHWPCFNLADTCICCAALFFILCIRKNT